VFIRQDDASGSFRAELGPKPALASYFSMTYALAGKHKGRIFSSDSSRRFAGRLYRCRVGNSRRYLCKALVWSYCMTGRTSIARRMCWQLGVSSWRRFALRASLVERLLIGLEDKLNLRRIDVLGLLPKQTAAHRSVYRLCKADPSVLAVVVSQDGGVRFVQTRDGEVTYWDQVSIGTLDL
jgi:hypothetical protein